MGVSETATPLVRAQLLAAVNKPRGGIRHTWGGMLFPPYPHPVTHSLRNQIVGLRHYL